MRLPKLIALTVGLAVLGLGQNPVQFQGLVLAANTGQPLGGVQVTLTPGREYRRGAQLPGTIATSTAADGTFVIAAPQGPFMLYASAPDYFPERAEAIPINTATTRSMTLLLVRKASLEGRLVDSLTTAPIAGMRITPALVRYDWGQAVPDMLEGQTSGRDGSFRFTELIPGTYVLHLAKPEEQPTLQVGKRLQDASPAVTGYGEQWWPGGQTPFDQGVRVSEGARVTVPDIRISQRTLLRLGLSIKADQCTERDRYTVTVARFYGTVVGRAYTLMRNAPAAEIPCDTPFLIDRLSPAEYDLEATSVTSAESQRKAASEHIGVFNDSEWMLQPKSGVLLDVSAEVPDGFPEATRSSLRLEVRAVQGASLTMPQPTAVARFPVSLQADREVQLSLRGLAAPYYISKVTYAGREAEDTIVTPLALSTDQTVKITVAGDGATIQGTVRDRDIPAVGMTVVAVRIPIRFVAGFPVHYYGPADDQGRFGLRGLPPGTYRVLSVPRAVWDTEIQKPGVLGNLAVAGTEVTVGPSAVVPITLVATQVPVTQ